VVAAVAGTWLEEEEKMIKGALVLRWLRALVVAPVWCERRCTSIGEYGWGQMLDKKGKCKARKKGTTTTLQNTGFRPPTPCL